MLHRRDLKLAHGGLYRCCVESARQWLEEDPKATVREGDMVRCKWCSGETGPQMIVRGDVIQWNNPSDKHG